ncbi:MAG: hypothetical protein CVV41_05740 [Candidatus Riflebacteria bacterium HGW-Riflebacteria-1]|jgi:hypothetical protein|nr:MAG: hypothetical protein CVV41_05740 [Candidatus Riflebacteria bacterium HGW-Riflebacteria-1]
MSACYDQICSNLTSIELCALATGAGFLNFLQFFFVSLRLCARPLLTSAEALAAAAQGAQVSLFELLVIAAAGVNRAKVKTYFPVRAVGALHIFLLLIRLLHAISIGTFFVFS